MQPHTGMDVFVGFAGIQEVPRELLTEFHIGTAATPLPGILGSWQVSGEMLHNAVYHTLSPVDGLQLQTVQFDAKGLLVPTALFVTAACLQFAHGAGVGHCMYHTCCCNGIRKGTLSETSFKDYAVIGYFVPSLQTGAVPAVPSELVLALMDGNLNSLDC